MRPFLRAGCVAAFLALSSAGAASAEPLEECLTAQGDLIQARACLRTQLESADAELAATREAIRLTAAQIDAAQGRSAAALRLQAAAIAFQTYREEACRLESAIAARNVDAGAWEIACAITRTRERVAELRALLDGPRHPALAAAAPVDGAANAQSDVASGPTGIDPDALEGDEQFRDWEAACFDDGCAAFARAQNAADFAVIVSWTPEQERWEVMVGRVADEASDMASPASIRAGVDRFYTSEPPLSWTGAGAALVQDADAVDGLLTAMRRGRTLRLALADEEGRETRATFSLMGASAALDWAAAQAETD